MVAGAALWLVLYGNSSIPNCIGPGSCNLACISKVLVGTLGPKSKKKFGFFKFRSPQSWFRAGSSAQVWSGRFWMGIFAGLSPKPHQMFSNDMEMIVALCKEAGYLPRAQALLCPVRTTRTYRDKNGVKRCVGKKKELRESQSPEYVFNIFVALSPFHDL